MAESNWYDFLIPAPGTAEKIEEGIEEGRLYSRIIGEEGVDGLITRLAEEELLNQGLSEDEVKKRISEEKKYTKLSSILPKDFALFGEAKAARIEAEEEKKKLEEPEVKFKEPEKVGLGTEDDYEIGLGQSMTGALMSSVIKIPKGVINFATLIIE